MLGPESAACPRFIFTSESMMEDLTVVKENCLLFTMFTNNTWLFYHGGLYVL